MPRTLTLEEQKRLLVGLADGDKNVPGSIDPDEDVSDEDGNLVFDAGYFFEAGIWKDLGAAMAAMVELFGRKSVVVQCLPIEGNDTAMIIEFVSVPDDLKIPDIDVDPDDEEDEEEDEED
ncbi:MAG: hypothetical protein WC702_01765 [Patescibacteria group bacterium]